jgi:hypothetical protein
MAKFAIAPPGLRPAMLLPTDTPATEVCYFVKFVEDSFSPALFGLTKEILDVEKWRDTFTAE